MPVLRLSFVVVVVTTTVLFVVPQAAQFDARPGTRFTLAVTEYAPSSDQRASIDMLEGFIARGDLRLLRRESDLLVPGRSHERYQQTYQGLPVIGADVAVQRRGPQVLSAFGVVYDGLAIPTAAAKSSMEVVALARANGFDAASSNPMPFGILHAPTGDVALVYTLRDEEGNTAYVSASDGSILLRVSGMQTQSAVGQATGVFGDSKKLSATLDGSRYVSRDALRPPAIETFDMAGDLARTLRILSGQSNVSVAELATSPNNTWTDGGVVDAHVYSGWVYDYYHKRFQRRGLDNNDVRIHGLLNAVRPADARTAPPALLNYFLNAGYSSACRCMYYGPGVPPGVIPALPAGVRSFSGALDVVAHELTHAVTDATSRLQYLNESGALNEAFSDVIGTSVEFFYQQPGTGSQRADYLLGEDLSPATSDVLERSMSSPTESDQPDHYFLRQYIGSSNDGGGVHINSGIANNAFYLAIEGGVHRYSRRTVAGVGPANREQIERVFYRAFTAMLSSTSSFYAARLATIQSARDLFGVGSSAERAVADAWDAVGVVTPGAALTTTYSPQRVPFTGASCGGVRPSFTFRVAVSEFQRVGFTVGGFAIASFDAAGRVFAVDQFSSATFRTWFNECQPGSTRIGSGATACATLCGSLGGRTSGYAQFQFTGVDDNGNPGTFVSDPLVIGSPTTADVPPDTELGAPTFSKVVRQ